MSTFGNEHWDLNKTTAVRNFDSLFLCLKNCFRISEFQLNCLELFSFTFQHPEGPSYMSDVVPPPFTPAMWNQEQPPPMVSYPELMGFPCSDLGKNLIE